MIKIMVDSASDIQKEEGLFDEFVPLGVNFDDKQYLDGIDLDKDTFYSLLTGGDVFPKTSQPAPTDFVEIFEKVKENGDSLIYFAISSELSGTYSGATIAKKMVNYDKIYIVDTLGATHMIRFLVEYANTLRNLGESAEQIVQKCVLLKSKVRVYAGLNTLEYLYKGGRLSRATATIGKVASIKPIISVVDGKVENVGKGIGIARAMQFIIDKMDNTEIDTDFPIYSLYTCQTENCELLEQKLLSKGYQIKDRHQVGPSIGTHVGPGVYAVAFVEK